MAFIATSSSVAASSSSLAINLRTPSQPASKPYFQPGQQRDRAIASSSSFSVAFGSSPSPHVRSSSVAFTTRRASSITFESLWKAGERLRASIKIATTARQNATSVFVVTNMADTPVYAVIGATGNIGANVTELLLEKGLKTKVIVRDAAKAAKFAGAEVATADITDVPALTAALSGVSAVFVVNPPTTSQENTLEGAKENVLKIAKAVADAKVPYAVVLSSIGGHLSDPEQNGIVATLFYLEKAFKEAGIPSIVFLRPSSFYSNHAGLIGLAKDKGIFPSLNTLDKKFEQVAPLDIGRVGVELLTSPPEAGVKVVALEGPELVSAQDVAAAFGKALGKDVVAVPIPEEAQVPTFTGFGYSTEGAELLVKLANGINNGFVIHEAGVEVRKGTVTFDEYTATLV